MSEMGGLNWTEKSVETGIQRSCPRASWGSAVQCEAEKSLKEADVFEVDICSSLRFPGPEGRLGTWL